MHHTFSKPIDCYSFGEPKTVSDFVVAHRHGGYLSILLHHDFIRIARDLFDTSSVKWVRFPGIATANTSVSFPLRFSGYQCFVKYFLFPMNDWHPPDLSFISIFIKIFPECNLRRYDRTHQWNHLKYTQNSPDISYGIIRLSHNQK